VAGVRLKWLKIEKYRNVAPGTELHFSNRFNVLLGKNGTGKTTLLRLLAMIVADELTPLAESPLEFSYGLALDVAHIDVEVKNEQREPAGGLGLPQFAWWYRVSFRPTLGSTSWEIRATQNGAELTQWANNKRNQKPLNLLPSPFIDRFLLALFPWFEANTVPHDSDYEALKSAWETVYEIDVARFDEGLGGFAALTEVSPNPAGKDLRPAGVTIAAEVSGKMLSGALNFAPFEIWTAIKSKDLNETISLGDSELSFLHKAIEAMSFKDATMLMRRRKKTVDPQRDMQRVSYVGFEFNFTLPDGAVIRHEDLSYGQKRLLSFLYYAAANPHIIIADELVNGLHYEWIETCLKEIQDRQSFLTSQNPVLVDLLPFESAEDVQRSFILCSYEMHGDRGQMVWQNMSAPKADAFYRAYETQALQVSEILQTHGLW